MARALERGRGVLRARTASFVLLLLAARPASAGWLESGLEALAERAGMQATVGAVERASEGGVRLRRVELSRPGFSLSVPEARLTLDWKALPRRRFEIAVLDIPELSVALEPASIPRATPSKSAWSAAARSIRIGLVRGRSSADGEQREWTARRLDLSFDGERVDVHGGMVTVYGSTAAVSGWARADGAAASLTADLSGRLAGRVRLVRDASGWSAEGKPSWEGLPLEGKAFLANDDRWTARVLVSDMGKRAPAWVGRLGALRGEARASGRGLGARGSGQARLTVSSAKGLSTFGSAIWSGGVHAGSATVSGLGMSGGLAWRGAPGRSTAAWSFEAAGMDLSPIGGDLRLSSASVRGTIESRAAGWHASMDASAESLQTERTQLRAVQLRAEGGAQSHTMSLTAGVFGTTVAVAGEGSWAAGAWRTRWEAFEASEATGTARGEASFAYSRGRVELRGSIRGVDLARLAVSAAPTGLGGELAAKAALSGPPRDLAGAVSFTVSGAMLGGVGPGTVRGEGTVSSGTVVLRECRWESGRAWAAVSGKAPFAHAALPPDFDLRLEVGGMDRAPLAVSHPWIEADGLIVDARMRLRRRDGILLSEGVAGARASALRSPRWDFSVGAASAAVVAAGESIQVSGGAAGRDGAVLSGGGRITLSGPDLTLAAQRLSFSPRPGAKADASLALTLAGSWAAPRLAGDVVILRAVVGPPPKPGLLRRWLARLRGSPRAPERPAEPPALPPRLAADLKVSFDRQVWYKDGATSVEFRGALRVRREPPAEPVIFGRVETLRGRLVYYGRTFELDSARLDFVGHSPPDPQVAARAVYIEERSRTRVLLGLTGPLSAPRAALSSEPPLEERDIFSVLAVGRPLDDRPADGEGSAGREAAERIMASYASQSVRQNLLGRLDLDVFQLRLDHERRSHLTVGRYVARDLFLTVENTFGPGGQRSVKAEYSITPVWSVEVSRASLGYSVIDLFYRKGFY